MKMIVIGSSTEIKGSMLLIRFILNKTSLLRIFFKGEEGGEAPLV
jgi:hypothetical protein